MITMKEILMGRAKLQDLPADVQENLQTLFERINVIRQAYGKAMKVNDGLRRPQDTPKFGAKKSNHYKGAAVDLDDNDAADLWNWLKDNLELLQQVELWIEDPRWTHGPNGTWMHFQIFPPKSGKRIFVPSAAPAPALNLWDGQYDPELDKA